MDKFDEKIGRVIDSEADYYRLASDILERYKKQADNCDINMVGNVMSVVTMMERGLSNKSITKDQFSDMADKLGRINLNVIKRCKCSKK